MKLPFPFPTSDLQLFLLQQLVQAQLCEEGDMASTHDPLRAKAMGNAPALPDRVAKAAYPVPLLSSQVTGDYDGIFRRHLCCLLIKRPPKLILGLIGAANLRSLHKEVVDSLLSGTALKPRHMSLDKQQEHLASCTA
ncbi:unnamed protein product [Heligmosomoides polygyrus]|uniref:Uncharacterized protein n=1 Tax=Heligmosomoides polygyrus TaxID=6339 RepID=A0A183GL36_HELPZ|nr:unnamed protein product [Heligmosomoides polygyrus]